jgi:hypothetical protein
MRSLSSAPSSWENTVTGATKHTTPAICPSPPSKILLLRHHGLPAEGSREPKTRKPTHAWPAPPATFERCCPPKGSHVVADDPSDLDAYEYLEIYEKEKPGGHGATAAVRRLSLPQQKAGAVLRCAAQQPGGGRHRGGGGLRGPSTPLLGPRKAIRIGSSGTSPYR